MLAIVGGLVALLCVAILKNLRKISNRLHQKLHQRLVLPPLVSQDVPQWDLTADVVVVGFGGAGASAAVQAAEGGAKVIVVERFHGGGTTRISGGVLYAGGGTSIQREAKVEDDPENMRKYLEMEVGECVRPETLTDFCNRSAGDIDWLRGLGVPFQASSCPFKTSYPPDQYFLYYSGNEQVASYKAHATPAQRGHRSLGKGVSGEMLYRRLADAANRNGIKMLNHTRAVRLITDSDGRVVGLEVRRCLGARAALHALISRLTKSTRYLGFFLPILTLSSRCLCEALESGGRRLFVRATAGVVLGAGGFVQNREMLGEHADSKFLGGVPLGAMGDDGSGISLGQSVGGAVGRMDRVSAWRFINPPSPFVEGILVDQHGRRLCNEQMYGATMGRAMTEGEGPGTAYLIIDGDIWRRSHWALRPSRATWFQAGPMLANLYLNTYFGFSIKRLARRLAVPEGALEETIKQYNAVASTTKEDPMGKDVGYLRPLGPSYFAVGCSLYDSIFICPVLTLGGLKVDEKSGRVLTAGGDTVEGLYAAGRTAVGVSSNGYVSGLSIADCVYSGRRAGRHAAAQVSGQ